MKSDLRKYLPPTNEQLRAFKEAMESKPEVRPDEEGLGRLMSGVNASARLERFREGTEMPSSLRDLIDTICFAYALSEDELAGAASLGGRLWRNVVQGKAEPYRIPAAEYARLAQRFRIGVDALKEAMLRSYESFTQHKGDVYVRFARSTYRSRKQEGYTDQLGTAFKELRTKSAARRQASAGDERINRFLRELDQCLS